jgi:hypothetical protein
MTAWRSSVCPAVTNPPGKHLRGADAPAERCPHFGVFQPSSVSSSAARLAFDLCLRLARGGYRIVVHLPADRLVGQQRLVAGDVLTGAR